MDVDVGIVLAVVAFTLWVTNPETALVLNAVSSLPNLYLPVRPTSA